MTLTEEIPWSNSGDELSDPEFCFEDSIDDDLLSEAAGSMPKLQPRRAVIKACWNEVLGMSEVLQHKGGLLISIGIVRNSKIYLSIEETLYLAEIGSLVLVDDKDTTILLKDIYEKVADRKGSCTWEYFEVYRYLKSLGYIVGRHNIPWSFKSVKTCSNRLEVTPVERAVLNETLIVELLKDFQISEMKLFFDVYLPNSKFRKTSPGDPVFTVSLARQYPSSISEIGELEAQCNGVPLKIVHVDHGRVSFFSFEQVELPTLL